MSIVLSIQVDVQWITANACVATSAVGLGTNRRRSNDARLDNGGTDDEAQKHADDCDYCGSARCPGRQGHIRAGQVHRPSTWWARVLRVQGIRKLGGRLH